MGNEWVISPRTTMVVGDDRVVALNLDTPMETPVVLEGSAAAIWFALVDDDSNAKPSMKEADIISEVAQDYDLPPETIAEDVREFLNKMLADGLFLRSDEREPDSDAV